MSAWNAWAAFFILVTVMAGLIRVLRGPTRADRMLAAQLFSTAGVAIVLLLGASQGARWLNDVALVFALLSAVATTAFVRLAWHTPKPATEVSDAAE